MLFFLLKYVVPKVELCFIKNNMLYFPKGYHICFSKYSKVYYYYSKVSYVDKQTKRKNTAMKSQCPSKLQCDSFKLPK